MVRQVKSRTERRMEKKNALIFLGLVLVISLISFSLGIMVGRSGSRGDAPAEIARQPLPPEPAARKVQAPEPPREKKSLPALTFYDTLPQGKQPPLGSGINLPPEEKEVKPAAEKKAERQVAAAVERKAEPQSELAEDSVASPPAPPKASSGGSYMVQVASFRAAEDAQRLSVRLTKGGYAAFTREADLGEKGVWTRVMIGPFESADEAARTVKLLQLQEKLSGIVKKRG